MIYLYMQINYICHNVYVSNIDLKVERLVKYINNIVTVLRDLIGNLSLVNIQAQPITKQGAV